MEEKIITQKANVWLETKAFIIAAKGWIIIVWLLFIMKLRLKMAIKMADMKHFISDKRYFVYPDVRTGGLLVLNNDEISVKKKQKIINKREGYLEVREKSFYVTATKRYGNDAPSVEEKKEMRQRYIRWQKKLKPILNRAKVGVPVLKKKKK